MPCPELVILDVGHGNCAVLKDEKGIVIIDAGAGSALLEFLQEEKIKRIDVVLISHADQDHIEGLVGIIASEVVEIGQVRVNSDASKKSALWDDLLYTLHLAHKDSKIDFDVSLNTRHTGEFNQGKIQIEILAPSLYNAGKSSGGLDRAGKIINSNSNSVVIRLSIDGKPLALLPGDLDSAGLRNLIEDGQDCTAPIVIFPHHGGRAGDGNIVKFTEEFCSKTNPELIIFSIGRGKHKTPRPELVETILKKVSTARIICTQLSDNCAAELPSIEQNYLADKFAKGKDKKHCCAGTITINLNQAEKLISPSLHEHRDFIINAIPNALCKLRT